MIAWLIFAILWTLVALKTYYELLAKDQPAFFILIGTCISILIILTIISKQRQHLDLSVDPKDRLSSYYFEYKKLHEKEIKQFRSYWKRTIGAALIGWIFFLWGRIYDYPLFAHPGIISLYFFFALLVATKGIEKGREVDRNLVSLTLKGARIERKLFQHKKHYFLYFTKWGRTFSYFFRVIPLVFIVFPLFKLGITPLIIPRFSHHTTRLFFETFPMAITMIGLTRYIFAPYWDLMTKYKKLVEG